MLQRLKQSLTEELDQVVNGQRQSNDPVKVIERNADVLKMTTPEISNMDLIEDGSAGASASPNPPHNDDTTENGSEQAETSLLDGLSPSELEGKLRKFAKYEEKYPQLLKAYRIEKKKGELVKLFEKVLSENTPCQTIAEPQQMLEFLDGLNSKAALLKQELERVSDAHSRLRKRAADTEQDLKSKLDEAEREIESLVSKDCDKSDEDIEALRKLLKSREDELTEARAAHSDGESDEKIQKLEAELAESQQKLKELDDAKAQLKELESVKKELAEALEAKSKAQTLETQLKSATAAKETLETELANSKLTKEKLEVKLADLQSKLDGAATTKDKIVELETKIKGLEATAAETKKAEETIAKLEGDLKSETAAAAKLKSVKGDLTSELESVKQELTKAIEAKTKLESEAKNAATMAKELESTKANLEKANVQTTELQATIKKLESVSVTSSTPAAPVSSGKKKKKGGASQQAQQAKQPEITEPAATQELTEKVKSLESELTIATEREATYKKQLANLETTLSELKAGDKSTEIIAERDAARKALDELEKKSAQQLTELKEAVTARDAAEKAKSVAEAAAKQAEEAAKDLKTTVKAAQEAAKKAEGEAVRTREELAEAQKAAEEAQMALETAKKESKAEIEKIKAEAADSEALGERAQIEINAAKDAAAAAEAKAEAQVKSAKDAAAEAESRAKTAVAEHKSATAKIVELEAANKELSQKRVELDKTVAKLNLQLTKHKDDLVSVQAKVKDFDAQKRALEDLEKKVKAQADIDRRMKVMEGEKSRLERQIATGDRNRSLLEQERADLLAQVRGMQSKVNDAEATAKAATVAQDGLRRQVDELGMRVSESVAKIDVLRDELADAQRLAHERLLETTSMRQMLAERADGHDAVLKDARDLSKSLSQERDQLEQEVAALGQRLVRETEQLRARVGDLSTQLESAERERSRYQDEARELRGKCDNMQRQLEEGQGSSQAVQNEVATLRRQLETTEASSRELSRAHALLKKVSEDTQTRLERLQKAHRSLNDDLDALRQENSQLRGQRSSSVSKEAGPTKSSEQEEYIKNVILGFLEHKEQRKQLLPVLSMLLHFDGDDEQRFWAAFS